MLSLWWVSFPIIALIFLLGHKAVALLFERGAFDAEATTLVTLVLMVLSLSILPYMLRDGVTRIFYAFNDARTPLLIGLCSIAVNVFFNALLVKPFGVGGIAFATVMVTLFNALVLSILVRRHIKDLGIREMFLPALRMLLATVAATGVTAVILGNLEIFYQKAETPFQIQALADILTGAAVLGAAYLVLMLFLKDPLTKRLLNRVITHTK